MLNHFRGINTTGVEDGMSDIQKIVNFQKNPYADKVVSGADSP